VRTPIDWRAISAFLLADGWHYPEPGTVWDMNSRIEIAGESGGYPRGIYLISQGENESDSTPCVAWDEIDASTGRSVSVIVKKKAINGVRTRSIDDINKIRVQEARSFISSCMNGNREMSSWHLDEIKRLQKLIGIFRERSSSIPATAEDTWIPENF
jgi:hypothetical protein